MITKNKSLNSSTQVQMRKITRANSRKKWSQREKKVLLSVMKKFGHSDVNKFVEVLPFKSKYQISRYLNESKNIAAVKLKKKYSKVQHSLQTVHQWVSLLNSNNDTDSILHKNLPALILPILEKYGTLSSKTTSEFNTVNFKSAYRFTFDSLRNFPTNLCRINDEIKALMFSSFNQVIDEVRCERNEVNTIFHTLVKRLINQQNQTAKSKIVDDEQSVFSRFEINSFRWTSEEIEILCQKKM